MPDPVETLRYAEQAGRCVEVTMYNGDRHFSGVHSVDEESGTFSLFAPQFYGDMTTRTELRLDDIVSLTLTGTPWRTE